MSGATPTSWIRPFVPGRDFEKSKAFFLALGFTLDFEGQDIAGFSNSSGSFLLQAYAAEGFAEHYMMAWAVDDLDAWYAETVALDLPGRFGVPAPRPPALQPWGLVISYLIDPTGVLWHVSQKP